MEKGFRYKKFVRYKAIASNCQVDCFHNVSPGKELYVREIVERISDKLGCSCVVSLVSRDVADLNREISLRNRGAVVEYHEILKKNFLNRKNPKKPYLLIVVHGMKDRNHKDIEIGTGNGVLADARILDWFVSEMKTEFSEFRVVVDEEFSGEKSLRQHRIGNEEFNGLGNGLNIFQVELSYSVRENFRDRIVEGIVRVLSGF